MNREQINKTPQPYLLTKASHLDMYVISREKLSIGLLVLAFNLEFVRNFIHLLTTYSSGGVEGSAGYQILAALLILFAALLIPKKNIRRRLHPYWRAWFFLWFLFCMWMLFHDISLHQISDQVSLLKLLVGWLPYFLILAAFVSFKPNVWMALNKYFIVHTIIGIVVVILGIVGLKNVNRFNLLENGTLAGIWSLYAVPYLILTFRIQKKVGKAVGLIGLMVLLLSGIFTLTRTIIINRGFLWIVLAVIIYVKTAPRVQKSLSNAVLRITYGALALVFLYVIFYLFVIVGTNKENIAFGYWQKFVSRIDDTSISNEARVLEAQAVIKQMSNDEWLLGRGIRGTWQGDDIYGRFAVRDVVHIGFLHFVFKGGVPLLLFFLSGPLVCGFVIFTKSRNPYQLAAAGILIQYMAELFTLGAPELRLWYFLIVFAFGTCLAPVHLTTAFNTKGVPKV